MLKSIGTIGNADKRSHISLKLMQLAFLPIAAAPRDLELIEDTVILVECTQLAAEVVVDLVSLDWLRLHVQVPDLDGQVVARHHVAPSVAEPHIRDARDDLWEEAPICRVLRLLEHCMADQREKNNRALQTVLFFIF